MPIGSLIGGVLSQGANNAAGAAEGAATTTTQQNIANQIDQTRGYLSPWQQVGSAATNQLAGLYGLGHLTPGSSSSELIDSSNIAADQKAATANFFTSPGYQFRLQQGTNALDRSAAARGLSLSGAQQKALSDYGQNAGSAEYGNYLAGLSGLSGSGLSAVESGNNTTAGLTTAGNSELLAGTKAQGDFGVAGANALGAGIVGTQNSLNSLLSFGGSGGKFGLPGFA